MVGRAEGDQVVERERVAARGERRDVVYLQHVADVGRARGLAAAVLVHVLAPVARPVADGGTRSLPRGSQVDRTARIPRLRSPLLRLPMSALMGGAA